MDLVADQFSTQMNGADLNCDCSGVEGQTYFGGSPHSQIHLPGAPCAMPFVPQSWTVGGQVAGWLCHGVGALDGTLVGHKRMEHMKTQTKLRCFGWRCHVEA